MTDFDPQTFDPANLPPAYFDDPYPFFAALRERSPVHRCPDGSVYLTRHADLFQIITTLHRLFDPQYEKRSGNGVGYGRRIGQHCD